MNSHTWLSRPLQWLGYQLIFVIVCESGRVTVVGVGGIVCFVLFAVITPDPVAIMRIPFNL